MVSGTFDSVVLIPFSQTGPTVTGGVSPGEDLRPRRRQDETLQSRVYVTEMRDGGSGKTPFPEVAKVET